VLIWGLKFLVKIVCPTKIIRESFPATFCKKHTQLCSVSISNYFPNSAQFIVGIGIPVEMSKKYLVMGLNFQFQYMLPPNITILKQHPEVATSRTLREAVNRESTYQALQIVMERRVMCYNQWYMAVSILQFNTYVWTLFQLRTLAQVLYLQ
jgi:hypothetical protein